MTVMPTITLFPDSDADYNALLNYFNWFFFVDIFSREERGSSSDSGVDYEKKKRKFGSPKLEMDKKKIIIKLGGGSSTDSSDDVRRTRSMSRSAVDVKQLEDKKKIYQIISI